MHDHMQALSMLAACNHAARRKLSMSRQLPCDTCRGSGTKSGKKYECQVRGRTGGLHFMKRSQRFTFCYAV